MKYPQNEIKIINSPLEHVSKRPGMYFENGANLACLEAMIQGIWMAERHHTPMGPMRKPSLVDIDMFEFEKWVRKKLGEKAINIRSFSFARKRCDGDEAKAFHLWFEWYDEFKRNTEQSEVGDDKG